MTLQDLLARGGVNQLRWPDGALIIFGTLAVSFVLPDIAKFYLDLWNTA